jgi:NTP pyrophosphatase (non-canonical NTP hydrolase)
VNKEPLTIEEVVTALRAASADTSILGVRVAREEIMVILANLPSPIDADPGMALFASLLAKAKERAIKAAIKFPQPNYVLNKFHEEAGEVGKEVIHYTENRGDWARVEDEIVDLLAMTIRLLKEGDGVIGFVPPYLKGDSHD